MFALYLCYLLDQRIHDGGGVERRFQVPLWSTLPELEPGAEPPPAFEAGVYRLYGQLPADKLARDGLVIGLVSSRRGEGVSFVARHFPRVLAERGVPARLAADDAGAAPGSVTLIEAPALLSNQRAFVQLKRADLILLVIEGAPPPCRWRTTPCPSCAPPSVRWTASSSTAAALRFRPPGCGGWRG